MTEVTTLDAAPAAAAPAESQVYTWEPSDATIAARYGVEAGSIVRFDTNTSPAAPDFVAEVLARPFEPPLNEYPDSAYADLTAAAAAHVGAEPGEILVGAGADEILDLCGKAFLPAGGIAVVPAPTYGMYGVLTSQRAAHIRPVPRLGPDDGFALDMNGLVRALDGADLVWLCDPNNPTGAREAAGTVERVLEASASVARGQPIVVVDEAYAEFVDSSVVALRSSHPNLVVVRTVSKAFALPGIRVGYAVATRATIARLERVRPPGSISTISATLAAEALRRPEPARARVAAIAAERDRFAAGLAAAGWRPAPSVTNFLLVRIGDAAAAGAAAERLLRAGLVPRTFGPDHPLAGHLRLTVRSPAEDDRLLDAIRP